jgi:protein tyrosine phosphatase (PTP) superfamily phosphohydrolase (DUF442 family)
VNPQRRFIRASLYRLAEAAEELRHTSEHYHGHRADALRAIAQAHNQLMVCYRTDSRDNSASDRIQQKLSLKLHGLAIKWSPIITRQVVVADFDVDSFIGKRVAQFASKHGRAMTAPGASKTDG